MNNWKDRAKVLSKIIDWLYEGVSQKDIDITRILYKCRPSNKEL